MSSSVALWLDPLGATLGGDRLFHRADGLNTDSILEPYAHLRERLSRHGIAVHTGDMLADGRLPPADINLYATMGLRKHFRFFTQRSDTVMSAFFVNECPAVEPRLFAELGPAAASFRRLFSYASDAAMAPFLDRPLSFQPHRFPYPYGETDARLWSNRNRGFLVIINSNKRPRISVRELYTERLRAIEFFGRRNEIDLYGVGWDGPSFRVGVTRTPGVLRRIGYRVERQWLRLNPGRQPLLEVARRISRGPVVSRIETLGRYTFSICFENQVLEGWVTEKIFDSLRAGTVPVYLGAPDIDRWVWPDCFIDMRRFSGYEELREHLLGLSPAEIESYREAGREYFASPEFRPFTKEAFASIFEAIVRQDAGVAL